MTLTGFGLQSSVSSVHCSVCGNSVHGRHYGVEACLGCTVFFRRAIYNKTVYTCYKGGQCVITSGKRKQCRYCRMRKCFDAGMKSEAVQYRDAIGPRLKFQKLNSQNGSDDFIEHPVEKQSWKDVSSENSIIRDLIILQSKQPKITTMDLDRTLLLGIKNAKDWVTDLGMQGGISGYQLSEFTVGLILIDYGYEYAEKEIPIENSRFLSNFLRKSMRKFDDFECACFKTLLLLNVSISNDIHQKDRDQLQNVFLIELSDYLSVKCPETAPIRFGEIILMLGTVRYGINQFYNQTAGSDVFHVIIGDPYFRSFFLEC